MSQQYKRPEILNGVTKKVRTATCGNIYLCLNFDGGKLVEGFARLGKAGGCASAFTEGIMRLVSIALQNGVPSEEIVHQLKGISCYNHGNQNKYPWSCLDAIGKVIEESLEKGKVFDSMVYEERRK